MNLVEFIKNESSEKEVQAKINKIIKKLTKDSNDMNKNISVIGPTLDVNPKPHIYTSENDKVVQEYNGYYCGFIPEGTKLVYGTMNNYSNLTQCTSGWFYYMDDFSYIYEFARYIKDKDIRDEFSIIKYAYKFLMSYYNRPLTPTDRNNIHRLLLKDHFLYFEPARRHSNRDFIGNGSAMCSEYASAICNILNVFGIQTVYLQSATHAYNIICIPSREEEGVIDYYLFDSVIQVYSYDMGSEDFVGEAYFEYIPNFDDEELYKFFRGETVIKLPNYYLVHKDDYSVRMYTDEDVRTYGIQTNYILDSDYIHSLSFKKN